MLNTFPELLVFGFFAPMILRVAVACIFFGGAMHLYSHRGSLAKTPLPIIGAPGPLMWAFIGVCVVLAGMLLFGWYTQIAALLGAIVMLKHAYFAKRYPAFMPYARSTYALAFVICVSLLITGAGAWAMDLPL